MKFTLNIQRKIIEKAKKYAHEKDKSLSEIVENYLRRLTKEEKNRSSGNLNPLNPTVKSLKGSFKMPKDMDYKNELQKRLEEKHL